MKNFVLFPFDKVEKNSTVILYAAGDIGKSFLNQIEATNYCKVVGFVDANADNIKVVNEYPCVTIEKMPKTKFDYIIIAKMVECSIDSIYELLLKHGIEQEKIIRIEHKYLMDYYESKKVVPENANWKAYYTEAEYDAQTQYESYLEPLFDTYLPSLKEIHVLDFACGEGRIANIAKSFFKQVTCCDIEGDALNFCQKRFENDTNVYFAVSGTDGIKEKDDSYQAIYSWDAMVHFTHESIDFYLGEFYRLLQDGGIAVIHHSNLKNNCHAEIRAEWIQNKGWRSDFSKEEMLTLAKKIGFEVLEQKVIDWELKDMDCLTVLKK